MSSKNVAVILVPDSELGSEIAARISTWHKAGIVEGGNAFLVREVDLSENAVENFAVTCYKLGSGKSPVPLSLFDELGDGLFDTREVVIPWILKNEEPNTKLAFSGHLLAKSISATLPNTIDSAKLDSSKVSSTLLSIPVYEKTYSSKVSDRDFYHLFNFNVIVSPELKTNAGAASTPITTLTKDFAGFAAAQIVTAAGLWAGLSEPLSNVVSKISQNAAGGTGRNILMRSSASMVIATGLATKIATEALERVSNPESSPFIVAVADSSSRPTVVLDEKTIREYVTNAASVIASDEHLSYAPLDPEPGIDLRLKIVAGWSFFFRFILGTTVAMAMHTRNWLLVQWWRVSQIILKTPLKEAYEEKYLFLDKQLHLWRLEIHQLREDSVLNRSFSGVRESVSQYSSFWKTLRSTIFSVLDSGLDAPVKKKEDSGSWLSSMVARGRKSSADAPEPGLALAGETESSLEAGKKPVKRKVSKAEQEEDSANEREVVRRHKRATEEKLTKIFTKLVLPDVKWVVADPEARYQVPEEILASYEVDSSLDLKQVSNLIERISDRMSSLETEKLRLEAEIVEARLRKEKKQVDDPQPDLELDDSIDEDSSPKVPAVKTAEAVVLPAQSADQYNIEFESSDRNPELPSNLPKEPEVSLENIFKEQREEPEKALQPGVPEPEQTSTLDQGAFHAEITSDQTINSSEQEPLSKSNPQDVSADLSALIDLGKRDK